MALRRYWSTSQPRAEHPAPNVLYSKGLSRVSLRERFGPFPPVNGCESDYRLPISLNDFLSLHKLTENV